MDPTLVTEMELMLPEIAVEVAQYLTPQDLSACCAVSTHWRQIFGSDQVWKQWCNPDQEAYLRTTPCVVRPRFSVPGERDSTLAPLSQWRTAFLREQHLWSNWRHGRCRTVNCRVERDNLRGYLFVANDLLLCFYPESIELWNVKVIPPICTNTLNFNEEFYHPVVYNNTLVTIRYACCHIEILKTDVTEGTIATKYQLFYNDVKQQPVLVEHLGNEGLVREPVDIEGVEVIITPGNKCFAYALKKDSTNVTFHIWDLDSGVKLKEELCLSGSLLGILKSTCDDVLVVCIKPIDNSYEREYSECRVYDVEKQQFLPFSQIVTYLGMFIEMYAIINNFVAINDYDDIECRSAIRIFNYRTGHQLHKLWVYAGRPLQILNNSCFVFPGLPLSVRGGETLCIVECPSGAIFLDVEDVKLYTVVGKHLLEILDRDGPVFFCKTRKSSTFKIPMDLPSIGLRIGCRPEVNQDCTRLVTSYRTLITTSHFW